MALWLLGVSVCSVHLAIAAAGAGEPVQTAPANDKVLLIPLEYREVGFTIDRVGFELHTPTAAQAAQLKLPPVGKGTKLVFGALEVGTNQFAFAWDRNKARLYLDLNQNEDFTDDAAGVFDAAEKGYSQKFAGIRLSVLDGTGQCDLLIDLMFYSTRIGFAELRSFYEGKLELAGQTWQIGVVRRPVASGRSTRGRSESALLIRPWTERANEFSLTDSTAVTVPFCETVQLWDKSYTPELVWQQCDGTNKPVLKLGAVETALGQLELAGMYVDRLVLANAPHRAAFFHGPARIIRLPVGTYTDIEVFLKNDDSEATAAFDEKVVVTANTTNTLPVGGPLTNSVTITQRGRILRMDYKLVGYSGKPYELVHSGRLKEPEFTIYKGDRRIASGKFQFG